MPKFTAIAADVTASFPAYGRRWTSDSTRQSAAPGLRTVLALTRISMALRIGGLIGVGLLATAAFATPSVTKNGSGSAARVACAPSTVILESPRVGAKEVQAKALNDRGDIVGFADSSDPRAKAIHAILWKGGNARDAVDLGVLPGYVSSEATRLSSIHPVLWRCPFSG